MINSILSAQREIFKLIEDVKEDLPPEEIVLRLRYISTFPLANAMFIAFDPNNEMDINKLEETISSYIQSDQAINSDELFIEMLLQNLK